MKQILVVVDDSAAALRAAQVAIDLAAALGSGLTFVAVVEDHVLDARLRAASIPEAAQRRAQGAVAMLSRMTARASSRGLRTQQEILTGPGAERVLAAAAQCTADLIVVGRDPTEGGSTPVNVGHLLEFADRPILVVPN
ncbi:nucleotide-binding universal stress UspA family protein [Kribbella sp. VKM Ac-2571]|uniref:universal stress protein n=1 Tax=Kribbella sp. VKM Ac-2571 TaxID=2512222 RepID=UPI0010609D4A|nr:universal stress protein [Kribbella sp. VKM Ac-2571]TDO58757.1 nucleotide-binding universal stress UspA family protein [Kribbella sp. VKM Ac-2571]